MKSLEKLLRPCGQNHLRWSCLSISFNFLSELGFNWTIDHNEDFNRQSRIELGGRLIRIAALTSDWSGMWAARTIGTSTSPSGSWVINSLNISIEIKPTDRFVFCNIFTRLLPSVDCVSWIFLPGAWSRGGGGADSPVSGCDNYPDPGPGVCLHPGSCYTVVTWHRVTLSRCHDHCDAVFITWSRQELVMWVRIMLQRVASTPGDCAWWPIMAPHNAWKETKILNRLKFYDKAPIDHSCTTFVLVSNVSLDPGSGSLVLVTRAFV